MTSTESRSLLPRLQAAEALRDALYDTAHLLIGLPKEGPWVRVEIVEEGRATSSAPYFRISVPTDCSSQLEGPNGETLAALRCLSREVAMKGSEEGAEISLQEMQSAEDLSSPSTRDLEVAQAQQRQPTEERITSTVQDWLEMLVNEDDAARARWGYSAGGALEIRITLVHREDRVRFKASEEVTRALRHVTEQIGEAVGLSCVLRISYSGG